MLLDKGDIMSEEYKKGEYCQSVKCENWKHLKKGDTSKCRFSCRAYLFHKWLDFNGYKIVKTAA